MTPLSSLKLMEVDRIRLHECHEATRLEETCRRIRDDGEVKNPIIALPLSEGGCLVLDGAHRFASLLRLGCRKAPVQLVDPKDVVLKAWSHLVSRGEWLDRLRSDPKLSWTTHPPEGVRGIRWMTGEGSSGWIVPSERNPSLKEELEVWHRVVLSYSIAGPVRRLRANGETSLPEGSVLFEHPSLSVHQLRRLGEAGEMLPAGVTRFTVRGRLLNLGVPLSWLYGEGPGESEWEAQCRRWEDRMRLYTESVYLCEA
ncbi:ParB-like nuclease family protein [Melghirimyces profundicolus]|uniref:ParB-like nuclease family protein n=1 Tax=Melghirimyces profundicolus TaxID=1242148 RepID=A0A2T6C8Q7_9BACL|nr:ParB N-terminal domain-containing protein [Melghirimyces profundicolus]PTX64683.1 ParB-like nuclease family protein [Melghirimyces profundicolus]